MLRRSCMLCMMTALVCSAAEADEPAARPDEVAGWGRVVNPSGDCDVALDRVQERLRIEVPGTAHVLSAEVPRLPMNAPRVVRGVRGDFTAGVHVLGRLEPGPIKTTHYDPYHGAGLIAWQDASSYLRLERAVGYINGRYRPYVNYELREGGVLSMSRGFAIEDGPLYLKLRRAGSRVLGLVQPRRTTVVGTPAREHGLRRTGRGGRRRRQLFRPAAVGRAGDVEHRGSAGFDGPGRFGPRLGRHRRPIGSSRRPGIERSSSRASEADVGPVRYGPEAEAARRTAGTDRYRPNRVSLVSRRSSTARRSRAHPGSRADVRNAFGSDAADTRMTRTPASEPLANAD